tara:strand:+ start:207 stop:440 length:234 start_codon:yes stop_codon:yes gene_type:complete
MSRLEKYQREHLENVAFDKAELYNEQIESENDEIETAFCKDILVGNLGADAVSNLSQYNLNMIIESMKEYANDFKTK